MDFFEAMVDGIEIKLSTVKDKTMDGIFRNVVLEVRKQIDYFPETFITKKFSTVYGTREEYKNIVNLVYNFINE